jgi:hypothetical protein
VKLENLDEVIKDQRPDISYEYQGVLESGKSFEVTMKSTAESLGSRLR